MKATVTLEEYGLVVVFEGLITRLEFLSHHDKILNDPRLKDTKFKIIDFTLADFSKLEIEDAYFPVAADHKLNLLSSDHALAFVAKNAHTVRFVEYYKTEATKLGAAWEIKIFASREEAINWIKSFAQ